MNIMIRFLAPVLPLLIWTTTMAARDWAAYPPQPGPGAGKHIVLLSGDEEYRSEEALPMLARILAQRHGFKCTVLFAINPADGTIDPTIKTNIPGLDALDTADLCVMLLRMRDLPDAQMRHFVDYVNRGGPVIALRTSTHAFEYPRTSHSAYTNWGMQSREWPGGFGQQVLGETWVNHHGDHGRQSTRGVLNAPLRDHPILRGVADIWGPTDVYGVVHLPKDAEVLVWGQVLSGMRPEDPPLPGPKNQPMMPVVWTRNYTGPAGKTSRIVTTTMGAAVDLESEDLRRLLVNACYWSVGLADKTPAKADVTLVGPFKPSWLGFGTHRKGVKPADFEMKRE